jgi:SAM-dependent methyltransferase
MEGAPPLPEGSYTAPGAAGGEQATCRACGTSASGARWYTVREMQIGLRESFRYFECAGCDCLQIGEVPADLGRYYPKDYLGHQLDPPMPGPRGWLRRRRNRHTLAGRGVLGRLLDSLTRFRYAEVGRVLVPLGVPPSARILDVGCGAGQLLRDLAAAGYRDLTGVDPFLDGDRSYPEGVRLLRRELHEVDGEFDLLLFVHSFEHVPNPRESLRSAARLLAPGGYCIVWSPTVPCYAWEHYREEWVQLDAPRHLLIPSPEGMRRMAQEAGLRLEEVRYDSDHLQFSGSELYRRGLPLMGNLEQVPRRKIRRWRRAAVRLNAEGRGDQAAFLLTKS